TSRRSRFTWLGVMRMRLFDAGGPCKRREAVQTADTLRAIDAGAIDGPAEHANHRVVGLAIHGERNTVFASVREREARRIARACVRAVDQLRGQSQRTHRSRSYPFHAEERLEVLRCAFVRLEQNFR